MIFLQTDMAAVNGAAVGDEATTVLDTADVQRIGGDIEIVETHRRAALDI